MYILVHSATTSHEVFVHTMEGQLSLTSDNIYYLHTCSTVVQLVFRIYIWDLEHFWRLPCEKRTQYVWFFSFLVTVWQRKQLILMNWNCLCIVPTVYGKYCALCLMWQTFEFVGCHWHFQKGFALRFYTNKKIYDVSEKQQTVFA